MATVIRRSSARDSKELVSGVGQPSDHKPRHDGVDQRLTGGAKPLVVLSQAPVVGDPREVRSATQRRGNFSKAGRFGSLPRSISRPSLNHSLAQILKTFSGGGLGVRLTLSTSKSSASSA